MESILYINNFLFNSNRTTCTSYKCTVKAFVLPITIIMSPPFHIEGLSYDSNPFLLFFLRGVIRRGLQETKLPPEHPPEVLHGTLGVYDVVPLSEEVTRRKDECDFDIDVWVCDAFVAGAREVGRGDTWIVLKDKWGHSKDVGLWLSLRGDRSGGTVWHFSDYCYGTGKGLWFFTIASRKTERLFRNRTRFFDTNLFQIQEVETGGTAGKIGDTTGHRGSSPTPSYGHRSSPVYAAMTCVSYVLLEMTPSYTRLHSRLMPSSNIASLSDHSA